MHNLLCSLALLPILPAPVDQRGDVLPHGALQRLGSVRWRHDGAVTAIACSQDGTLVATAGNDGSLRLWQAGTGKLLRILPHQGEGAARALALSDDGRLVAYAYGKRIALCTTADGKVRRVLEHAAAVNCLAFDPAGNLLVSACSAGSLQAWDTATAKVALTLATAALATTSVAFTPDGTTLFAARFNGTVHRYDAASGKEIAPPWKRQNATGATLAIAPDGKTLVLALEEAKAPRLVVCDLPSGKERYSQSLRAESSYSVACAADSRQVAVAWWSRRYGTSGLLLYDAVSGKAQQLGDEEGMPCYSVAFAGAGNTLYTGSLDYVRQWDAAVAKEITRPSVRPVDCLSVAYSPQGDQVATCDAAGNYGLWTVASGERVQLLAEDKRPLVRLAFVLGGKYVAAVLGNGKPGIEILLWDSATGKLHDNYVLPARPVVGFARDGKLLAAATGHGVMLWDLATRKLRATMEVADLPVRALEFSPDGQWLAIGENYNVVRLRNVYTAAVKHKLEPISPVDRIQFSADGALLLASSRTGILLWDALTGQRLWHWYDKASQLPDVSFTPAGNGLLTLYRDKRLELIDLADNQVVRHAPPGDGLPTCFAIGPSGKTLIAGYRTGTFLVWRGPPLLAVPQAPRTALSRAQMLTLWEALGSDDAPAAFKARWKLACAAGAVAFLRQELRFPAPADTSRIPQWIKELDHSTFKVREKAMHELEKLGEISERPLHAALDADPSPEQRRRLELLLAKIDRAFSREMLQTLRAIGVLEVVGGAEAREVLQMLAAGTPERPVTEAACAALARWQ